jgi:lysophospholipase L1-like esterase
LSIIGMSSPFSELVQNIDRLADLCNNKNLFMYWSMHDEKELWRRKKVRPMKRIALRLATITIGVIVALFLAEIVLRLYDRLSQPRLITYSKNSHGFRDREHSLTKKAGVLRIAFQGDSYTYGTGVKEEERFSERTGDLLSARLPGRKIEVLNFGRPGLNIAGDLASLKENVLPYDPDVIVFGLVLNDFDIPQMEQALFGKSQREVAAHKWLIGFERYSRLAYYIDLVSFQFFSDARRIHLNYLNDIWDPETNPFFEKMRNHLYELIEIISKRKGIVVFFPYFVAANEKDLPFYLKAKRIVSEVCRAHGCRFLEILPLLSHKPFRHWWVTPLDHHPNAEADAIIARAIADILAKTL